MPKSWSRLSFLQEIIERANTHNNVDNIRCFGARRANQEIVGFNIAVYKILLVNGLDTVELVERERLENECSKMQVHEITICLASMQVVLRVNFRPHKSNKSSRFGPKRSMTRTL